MGEPQYVLLRQKKPQQIKVEGAWSSPINILRLNLSDMSYEQIFTTSPITLKPKSKNPIFEDISSGIISTDKIYLGGSSGSINTICPSTGEIESKRRFPTLTQLRGLSAFATDPDKVASIYLLNIIQGHHAISGFALLNNQIHDFGGMGLFNTDIDKQVIHKATYFAMKKAYDWIIATDTNTYTFNDSQDFPFNKKSIEKSGKYKNVVEININDHFSRFSTNEENLIELHDGKKLVTFHNIKTGKKYNENLFESNYFDFRMKYYIVSEVRIYQHNSRINGAYTRIVTPNGEVKIPDLVSIVRKQNNLMTKDTYT